MKPFSTIAIPHRDILGGRLTMDVFAANLWEVYKSRAPEDYRDSNTFFRKTYITEGLKNLLAPHQPLLILMDEILEYVIAASGIKVEDSTLASQVLTFMRRLTDTVRTLDKTILITNQPNLNPSERV